jgi:two-component system NtrC family response regulator
MEKPKLLIVDDDEGILKQLKWALQKDYKLFLASDRKKALEFFQREQPPVVALDLGLPPLATGTEEGFRLLQEMLQQDPLTKVIIITGNSEREKALLALQQGAHDYYTKPIVIEEIQVMVRRAYNLHQLEKESILLQQDIEMGEFKGILGTNRRMKEVLALIKKVAIAEVPVLVTGESGTGKELIAQAIHQHSTRKDGPFLVINCGAIPETLLESELFGHERGAFTGAHTQRKGKLEYAHNGTLFLDEIGELALSLQVKLLRFLQEHKIERLGGRKLIPLNTRIIAATNRDLKKAMEEGSFREDLFYRLGVVQISLPPLRERGDDVPLLAQHFLKKYAQESRKKIKGFSPEALKAIRTYTWPGNVRELENKIKRAVLVATHPLLTCQDMDLALARNSNSERPKPTLLQARQQLEQKLILKAMIQNNWNITQAAVQLGISRQALYNMLIRYGIKENEEGCNKT